MREAELGVVSRFYICFLLGSLESQRYLMTAFRGTILLPRVKLSSYMKVEKVNVLTGHISG